jgi:predicted metal-dependent hydrolase
VTIDPREGVVVSVPPATRRGWANPESRIQAFLGERTAWVVRHLDELARERESSIARGGARDGGLVPYRGELHLVRVHHGVGGRRSKVDLVDEGDRRELVVADSQRDRRDVGVILGAWLRDRAREAIDEAVSSYAAALGVEPTRVDIRDPRSRWGSASRTRRLMLSWRLVLAPPASLETVVVHELAHLRVFGHGPRFWALVATHRPSHLADRAWLRRNSFALHTALDVGSALAGAAAGDGREK